MRVSLCLCGLMVMSLLMASAICAARAGDLVLESTNVVLGKLPLTVIDATVTVNKDATRLAYVVVRPERAGQGVVVVDGKEGREYDGAGGFVFSHDGRRFLYMGRRNLHQYVVVDGVEGATYDFVAGDSAQFSPDDTKVAYAASRAKQWFAVVNGVEGRAYDWITGLTFSPDGQHLSYAAKRDGRQYVVVDAEERGPYSEVGQDPIAVIGSPAQVAFVARQDAGFGVVHNLDAIRGYAESGNPILSPDGLRLAFYAKEDMQWRVVVDGKPGARFDQVGRTLRFSPDSRRFAHRACLLGMNFVVLDGRQTVQYERIADASLQFSPDSKHFGFLVEDRGKAFAVVDWEECRAFDRVSGPIEWTRDGSKFAYLAEELFRQFVVVNDEPGPPCDEVAGFRSFTPDGAHYVYGAAVGSRYFIRVDDQEVGPFDGFVRRSLVSFRGDDRFCVAATAKRFVYRVEVRLIASQTALGRVGVEGGGASAGN